MTTVRSKTVIATYDEQIEQIVQSIFSTMLETDVSRVARGASEEGECLVSSVQITGQWVGSVVLCLSATTARSAASAMLRTASEDVTEADQQDIAAELVNMIGGNLKSLLPGPSSLSLPTVVAGPEFRVRMHKATLVDEVKFVSDAGSLQVSLYAESAGSAVGTP